MAGFWAGFGEQLSENVEQRKKTLDRLIEENLANARAAKGKYTKNKQVANTNYAKNETYTGMINVGIDPYFDKHIYNRYA